MQLEDSIILAQAKKDQLEDDFAKWLRNHFDALDQHYIDAVIFATKDEDFLMIAEAWASNTSKNKVYY